MDATGELVIESPVVARAYLGGGTGSRSPSDNGTCPATRIYTPGDLCRYNAHGSIQYLGRKDSQIKLHGQRVELSEIEHHLNRAICPYASGLIALTDSGHATAGAVVALMKIDPEAGNSLSLRDLASKARQEMSLHLPPFALPSKFAQIETIPRTQTGGIDRKVIAKCFSTIPHEHMTILNNDDHLKIPTSRSSTALTAAEVLLQRLWA